MRVSLVLPLVAALLAVSGCRDARVENYQVAAEKPEPLPPVLTGAVDPAAAAAPAGPAASSASAGATMANTAVPTASGPGLSWTAPAHWTAKPPSPMRKGSYAVPGETGADGDFSVTAFPGNVGGEVANFNRWRGQINLPPLAEADYAGAVTRFEHNGLAFAVVDFANPAGDPPQRMLGAIVPLGDATWFFKLTGPEALVAREKAAFLDLLRTVQSSAQP